MLKMPSMRENHNNIQPIGSLNDRCVFERTAGLNDCPNSGLSSRFNRIRKRKEGIRSHISSFHLISGLFKSKLDRPYPIHLTCPNTQGLSLVSNHNGVGFHMFHNPPSKIKLPKVLCRRG